MCISFSMYYSKWWSTFRDNLAYTMWHLFQMITDDKRNKRTKKEEEEEEENESKGNERDEKKNRTMLHTLHTSKSMEIEKKKQ